MWLYLVSIHLESDIVFPFTMKGEEQGWRWCVQHPSEADGEGKGGGKGGLEFLSIRSCISLPFSLSSLLLLVEY